MLNLAIPSVLVCFCLSVRQLTLNITSISSSLSTSTFDMSCTDTCLKYIAAINVAQSFDDFYNAMLNENAVAAEPMSNEEVEECSDGL